MKGFLAPLRPWGATIPTVALAATLSALVHAASDAGNFVEGTVKGTGSRAKTIILANDRYPALYTGKFGDCLGGNSQIDVTGFDAAYYADNMTVMFHLTGTTKIKHDNIMAYISVDAYGEDRKSPDSISYQLLTYCSLCPMNASTPIAAEAIIPVTKDMVSGIPPIALVIPDFEGYATLRLYSNTTKTEIGCYQAVMTNGATFSHPKAVGSVLAIFTSVALLASAATAIYGVNVPVMRTHYAHSLSVLVIFELFQSFFFSGALSLQWPSVCVAWWSNFAWSAGMINNAGMTRSISNFLGTDRGNSSHVGGVSIASLGSSALSQIYGKPGKPPGGVPPKAGARTIMRQVLDHIIGVRDIVGASASQDPGYSWYGGKSGSSLPLPGVWSNFTGELSEIGIPAPNAFMTGFIWFLIALVIVIGLIVGLKWILEGFSAVRWIRKDRLDFFRSHWVGYVQMAILRTMMVAFFMMMTLTIYQFSISGPARVTAIAAIVFATFLVGLLGIAAHCCFNRLRFGRYESGFDHVIISRKKVWKFIPWPGFSWHSKTTDADETAATHIDSPPVLGSFPMFVIRYVDDDPLRPGVHEDPTFIKRYGWLSGRFRRTRWWFFALWFLHQFVRACFVGGASRNPEAQVVGLFVVEIIAMIIIVALNPFEGNRNTALAVYLLSLSKVVTAGLSIAFLPRYNMARIPTTIVGFVIVITQGVVAIATLILIVLGAISSYMSLTRNREDFKPRWLEGIRYKYFTHLERAALDIPPPPPPPKEPEKPAEPIEPYFKVNSVHREPKIEDEQADILAVMTDPKSQPIVSGRRGRANSALNTSSVPGGLPFGARAHRASWSSQDFTLWQQEMMAGSLGKGGHSRHNSVNKLRHSSGTMAPLIQSPQSLGSSDPITTSNKQHIVRGGQWPLTVGESSQGSSAENLQEVTIKE
ncbi:hypothetical protein VE04_00815 [Pseudogymnoascus sp. 24MN13]|nr:hypothetical protein VE04_00815 [Pseudogymnoascus sp. 24MN13]